MAQLVSRSSGKLTKIKGFNQMHTYTQKKLRETANMSIKITKNQGISKFSIVFSKKTSNCVINYLHIPGEQQTRSIKMGFTRPSLIGCTLKLDKLSEFNRRQLKQKVIRNDLAFIKGIWTGAVADS